MRPAEVKKELCEIGRRLYNRGFAAANDGNLSVRVSEDEILCTPTLVSKGFMRPADICTLDSTGKQLRGRRQRTSEILLHLEVYKARADIHAVVHCHPPHATAFAVTGEAIPHGILPEVEIFLGQVPTSPYATPGTAAFAQSVRPYLQESNTIVLANHGIVTFAPTLETAYFQAEIADAYCRVLLLARQLGPVQRLSASAMDELTQIKKGWQQKGARRTRTSW